MNDFIQIQEVCRTPTFLDFDSGTFYARARYLAFRLRCTDRPADLADVAASRLPFTCCDYPISRPSLVDADFRSASKFLAVLSQRQHDPKRLVCREIGNGLPEYLERFVEPRSGGRVPDQILLGTTSLRRPRKNKETSTTTKVFSIASSK